MMLIPHHLLSAAALRGSSNRSSPRRGPTMGCMRCMRCHLPRKCARCSTNSTRGRPSSSTTRRATVVRSSPWTSVQRLPDRRCLIGVCRPRGLGMWGGGRTEGSSRYAAALCGQGASTAAVGSWRGGILAGKPAVSEDTGAWATCQCELSHDREQRTKTRSPTPVFSIYVTLLQATKDHRLQKLFAAFCHRCIL